MVPTSSWALADQSARLCVLTSLLEVSCTSAETWARASRGLVSSDRSRRTDRHARDDSRRFASDHPCASGHAARDARCADSTIHRRRYGACAATRVSCFESRSWLIGRFVGFRGRAGLTAGSSPSSSNVVGDDPARTGLEFESLRPADRDELSVPIHSCGQGRSLVAFCPNSRLAMNRTTSTIRPTNGSEWDVPVRRRARIVPRSVVQASKGLARAAIGKGTLYGDMARAG